MKHLLEALILLFWFIEIIIRFILWLITFTFWSHTLNNMYGARLHNWYITKYFR